VRALLRKVVKYAAVSAIATSVSLTILGLLIFTRTTTAGWANVIATAAATIPSFELNRRWVWGKMGRRSVWAEMGPFWVWCFVELGVSTLVVSNANRWAISSGMSLGTRTFVAEAANVLTFGTLWILQFALLDRILFRNRDAALDRDDDIDDDGRGSGSTPVSAPATTSRRPREGPTVSPGAVTSRVRAAARSWKGAGSRRVVPTSTQRPGPSESM
jgi:putative flippase GtrA